MRIMPTLDEPSSFFWTSGADNVLRILGCDRCGYLIHPPAPYCPSCGGREATPTPLSGRGVVHSFTVNHQAWDDDPEPYVLGIVELSEQPGLRLTTNIVDVEPDEVHIDMAVEVVFEDHDPVYLPLFRPAVPDAAIGSADG